MLRQSSRAPNPRGFTLIELAIAMAIFGFLIAAALPSIGAWMDNTRIRNVAESIQNGLQATRAEAIRRNQSISFYLVSLPDQHVMSDSCELSGSSGSWVISVTSPNGHCAEAPSTTQAPMIVATRTVGDAGAKVSVTAIRSDGSAWPSITFNGFGRVVSFDPTTGEDIAISQVDVTGLTTDTEYRYLSIRISPTGMVRMCDPRVTVDNDPRKC